MMTQEEFREIRISLKLSQRKLALILERNVRTIQRYESGVWDVSVEVGEMMMELMEDK